MKDSYGTKPTACLALSDGTVFYGEGFGSTGRKTAELCFNTSMTGYQEILTDPSYAGQIVTFTFPHIGNVGVNLEDNEANMPFASGMVVKWRPTLASNWRSQQNLIEWLENNELIAIGGIDTRRLTRIIRKQGAPHVAIEHNTDGDFDTDSLINDARNFAGLSGLDLAKNLGQFVGKAKGMAREFSRAMDQAADDAGVKDISKTISAATNPVKSGIDGLKTAAQDFTSIDPDSETGKLAKERADAAAKIKKAAAEKAEARLASEAAAEAAEIKPEDVSVDAKTQETVAEAKGEA